MTASHNEPTIGPDFYTSNSAGFGYLGVGPSFSRSFHAPFFALTRTVQ